MANVCEVTGKRKLSGNRVSHANNKTRHFQQPNIQARRLFVPELNLKVLVRLSNNGLRTLDKHGGLSRFLLQAKPQKISQSLRRLQKVLRAKVSSKQ